MGIYIYKNLLRWMLKICAFDYMDDISNTSLKNKHKKERKICLLDLRGLSEFFIGKLRSRIPDNYQEHSESIIVIHL